MLPSRPAPEPNGVIMGFVPDHRKTVDELASLVDEFKLDQASLQIGEFKIAFARRRKAALDDGAADEFEDAASGESGAQGGSDGPTGEPVNSPMAGIFYA